MRFQIASIFLWVRGRDSPSCSSASRFSKRAVAFFSIACSLPSRACE